jgi:hypothetical protein
VNDVFRSTSRRYLSSGLKLGQVVVVALALAGLFLPKWLAAQGAAPTRNPVLSVAVPPGAPNIALAGTLNSPDPPGIYRSTDGGMGWSRVNTGLVENVSIAGLAFDPVDSQLVLAGDGGFGYLFRSRNGGQSWEEIPAFRDLLTPNSAVGELYSALENGRSVFYACTRFDGVLRSDDAGDTWQRLDGGLVGEARRVREVLLWGDTLYAGTHAGLYRLPPGAVVWEQITSFPTTSIVFSLTDHAGTLLAGAGAGLFQSADGVNWTRVANFPSTVVYDVVSTGRLVVAVTENGIWNGAGESWQLAQVNGAPYSGVAYAVANTGQAPRTIYAGTVNDWVLRSDDEGVTFYAVATMPPLDVRAALATPTPTFTPTLTPTDTPTPTNTPTDTPTPTETPTHTPTPVPTDTLVPTDTPTPTPLPTETPSRTPTMPPDTPAPTPAVAEETPVVEEVTPTLELPTATAEAVEAATIPRDIFQQKDVITVSIPTVAPPTPTPVDTPTPAPTTAPATETATPAPTDSPTITLTPSVTPTPTVTPTPIDVVQLVYTNLPPVFVGASALLVVVIIAAGISVIRGPRDI